MSIEPVDALLDHVGDAPVLAEVVEGHLEQHPLPVDEAEVARIAARLERRIRPRRRWGPGVVGVGALLAAMVAGVIGLRPEGAEVPVVEVAPPAPEVLQVRAPERPVVVDLGERPGVVVFDVGRTLVVEEQSSVLSSDRSPAAVVLVQRGSATSDGTHIPEGHWGVLTTAPDGSMPTVVFPDGQAPPTLPEDVYGEGVSTQLQHMRWDSLPPRTLEALDLLLEDR